MCLICAFAARGARHSASIINLFFVIMLEKLPVRNRHDQNNEENGQKRAETDHYTHRLPEHVASDDHREHSESGGARCKEYRTHTSRSCHHGRFLHGVTFFEMQFFGIFEQDDSVTDNDADQADES